MTSTIKVNNVQNQCGQNIINENSNTITIGASGDTIALASGASQTGFGREGSVNWQTGSIKTTTFTAVSGEGYFVNTTGGAVTANLPAGSAGAIVSFADYTRTFGTNNLTISPNGSEKIGGIASDAKLNVGGQSATFVYVDATEGWINVQETQTSQTGLTGFIMATGGTETISGNCKIHTFTGPGSFCVSNLANTPACNQVSYLVVAGGGGGGTGDVAGGAGAGGFREDKSPITPYTASPLEGAGTINVTASTTYPITIGAGGALGPASPTGAGSPGTPSIFSTITSAGGGGGAFGEPGGSKNGLPGGSGGGAGYSGGTGGSGNTPPVSPPQGSNGGTIPSSHGGPAYGAAGGGGATATGGTGSPSAGGNGGAGATTSITASPVAYAGGGGGGRNDGGTQSSGGSGGGGAGGNNASGAGNGTANTGGGGGGTDETQISGGVGGSGVVIIRYKFQ